jgi:hypothetical protein
MPKPKDLNELREQLLDAFDMVKTDPRRQNQVKEMSNAAGKIVAITKLQVEYAYLRGEEPDVPFIGKTSGKPLKPNARLLSA